MKLIILCKNKAIFGKLEIFIKDLKAWVCYYWIAIEWLKEKKELDLDREQVALFVCGLILGTCLRRMYY